MKTLTDPIEAGVSTPALPLTKKTLARSISAIVLTGACISAVHAPIAFAQDANEANDQTSEEQQDIQDGAVEIVEVTGIRFSQRSALERKKSIATMSDSIIAEDIGQFPDKNVGEALQRITGVQLNRDMGEGANISIRGVEPELVRVELNGIGAMGMGASPDGREVDFRDMASELVKSIDVIKGSEARLTVGGVGGTVKVETRKPNDFKDHYLRLKLENQYNDLADEHSPNANITGVYKFNEDFGILANITAGKANPFIHALRNTEWVLLDDYDMSGEKTFVNPDYADVTNAGDCPDSDCEEQWYDFSPRIPRYGIWEREEDRISANVTMQYRFNDDLQGHIGYTHNERNKRALDRNLQLDLTNTSRFDPASVTVDDRHNVTSLTTANAIMANRVLEFDWNQKTSILDAGLDYTVGKWDFEALVGVSTMEQEIFSTDATVEAHELEGITLTLDDRGAPDWDLTNAQRNTDGTPFDVNEPGSWWRRSNYRYTPDFRDGEEKSLQFDATYNFENSFFTSFRTGFRVGDMSLFREEIREANIRRNVGSNYGPDDREWTIADQIALIEPNVARTPQLFDGFDLGVSTIGSYDAITPLSFVDDYLARIEATNSGEDSDSNVTPRVFYNIDMATEAVYLQADFEIDMAGVPVWGNFGARYVETQTDTFGDVNVRVEVDELDDPDHELAFTGRREVSNKYDDFLPSINVNIGIIPDTLIAYVGAAKVMAHPKSADLNINANCTIRLGSVSGGGENECDAGNPYLDPYRAKQYDLALSWYPNADSLVSVAYFEKDIESFVLDNAEQFDRDFFGDGILYDVEQPVNGEGVTTKGVEFQAQTHFTMLPAPFDGLGGSFNYTHMTADNVGLINQLTGEALPFPAQSEDSYNISLYYETETIATRLAYNYRDRYLLRSSDRGGNPVFVEDTGHLDAKVIYEPKGSNFQIYMDARNLLKQEHLITNGEGRLSDLQWSGVTYSVGFTYTM